MKKRQSGEQSGKDSTARRPLGKLASLFKRLRAIRRSSPCYAGLADSFRGISPTKDPYDVEIGWTQGTPIIYEPLSASYLGKLSKEEEEKQK